MKTISATKAQENLYKLLKEIKKSGEPIHITGKRANAVLVSEDNWRAISETLYPVSISGMRESICKGLETPVNECDTELE